MYPIGAGAFSVTDIRRAGGVVKEISLKRNKAYALGKPYLDTIAIVSYPNQDSVRNALASGAIDMSLAIDTDTIALNPLPERIVLSKVSTPESVALYRSNNETTLNNAALVTILDRFIDKDAIIATVEHGYGTLEDASTESGSSFDSTLSALQSIGFIYKDGVLTKNGNPVGFSIAVSNDSHNLAAARMLANTLGSLGMIVSVKAFDQGTFQDDIALSQYSVVLANTNSGTISNAYRKVLMLYTKTLPYAVNETVHGVIPTELQSPILRYSNSKDWYTKTDRIWKWLTKKDTE
jgi:ABC-type transport system substrate-binding protein